MKKQVNLTFHLKYAILYYMFTECDRRRVVERQKAIYRKKIEFHKKNVILQSMVTILCVTGGIYAGQKRSIAVPLVLAPMASVSFSKLAKHESKRRYYQETLKELGKE